MFYSMAVFDRQPTKCDVFCFAVLWQPNGRTNYECYEFLTFCFESPNLCGNGGDDGEGPILIDFIGITLKSLVAMSE